MSSVNDRVLSLCAESFLAVVQHFNRVFVTPLCRVYIYIYVIKLCRTVFVLDGDIRTTLTQQFSSIQPKSCCKNL